MNYEWQTLEVLKQDHAVSSTDYPLRPMTKQTLIEISGLDVSPNELDGSCPNLWRLETKKAPVMTRLAQTMPTNKKGDGVGLEVLS